MRFGEPAGVKSRLILYCILGCGREGRGGLGHGALYYTHVSKERILLYFLHFFLAKLGSLVVDELVLADWLLWVSPVNPWMLRLSQGTRH
mmetsp:Transcript_15272/g.20761  ORF Transcript_15272/g.20761 Transcript_15272/m.20761 type:complete len:90 (-) Transcript_15272:395-664(-)